jgi:3,4-dihydroxy-2-butanone 4-phosphate synthase
MVILRTEQGRGAGGELLLAAKRVDAEAINFMTREARGIVRLALAAERADSLGLSPIGRRGNSSLLGESSMVSIEAAAGVSTGISAADRARTIVIAADPRSRPDDLRQPGHVFPLRADPGGVLATEDRIEAAVDLTTEAGLGGAAVLCQILRDDGEVATGADLDSFAGRHGLAVLTVSDVIDHRRAAASAASPGDADTGRLMCEVMGHFATGVSVVTARDEDGISVGTTAKVISLVSLDPPLLLACLASGSESLAAIRQTGRFAVNILSADQGHHADRFAAKGASVRADEVEFDDHTDRVPVLLGALATIACEVEAVYPAGDHEIVIGYARHLHHHSLGAKPLFLYRGSYSQLHIEEDEVAAS